MKGRIKETIDKREKQKQINQNDRSKREQIRGISMNQQRGRHEKEGDMKANKIYFWHWIYCFNLVSILITWLVDQFGFPSMPKRDIVKILLKRLVLKIL